MGKEECCECCCGEGKKTQTMTWWSIEISDRAWAAILQRKMEAMLEKTMGKQMDNVASVAFEYAVKYHMAVMQGKTLPKSETDAFEKKLSAAMMG